MFLLPNSRQSIVSAIVIFVFAYFLCLALADHSAPDWTIDWVVVPSAFVIAVALVVRFWWLEGQTGIHLHRLGLERDVGRVSLRSLARHLLKLRIRSWFVAASTFFALGFIIPYSFVPVLGLFESGLARGHQIFWSSAAFEAFGLTAVFQNGFERLIRIGNPEFIIVVLFVILIPLMAIACVLVATVIGCWGAGGVKIALLRPFGERAMTKALKQVVWHRLGRVGFVYTLSDRNYRRNFIFELITRLWGLSEYILGPILRPSIRYMYVGSPAHVGKLLRRMAAHISPSFRTALSGNQALNIRSTDDYWKEVVDTLLSATDLVIMDVSKVGGGSAWEVERLFTSGKNDRCIFIVQRGFESRAAEAIATAAPNCEASALHVFDANGRFVDDRAFQWVLALQLAMALDRAGGSMPQAAWPTPASQSQIVQTEPEPVLILTRVERDKRWHEIDRAVRRGRFRAAVAAVMLCALVGASWRTWIFWSDVKERNYATAVMRPAALAADLERETALGPKFEFAECTTGCPVMVVVPAGKLDRGTQTTNFEHFAVGKFDLTFSEWDHCVAAGACAGASDNGWGRDKRPVVNVSWNETKAYVQWISRVTGKDYRLLTDAEFEYAARAGSTTHFPWGNDIGKGNANCDGCGSHWDNRMTAPAGSFKPNAFGLYDMHGNISKWCEDLWLEANKGGIWSSDVQAGDRTVRSGGWHDGPRVLETNVHYNDGPEFRYDSRGFRVARTMNK